MKFILPLVAVLLSLTFLTSPARAQDLNDGFSQGMNLPTKQSIVVSEGTDEAKSMGSYAIRLYAAPGPSGLRFENFQDGKIVKRDGSLKKVELADIDGDGNPEVIVIIQSAGSGGYIDAEAWKVDKNKLMLLSTVGGMKPNINPVHEMIRAWNVTGSE